ncbi:MAG TPA: hypothetical protein VFQ30_00960 [Ktedonobacteraceae bacterium]|nr:hypothetical protein [Ktedonobacteraceae bacterium]
MMQQPTYTSPPPRPLNPEMPAPPQARQPVEPPFNEQFVEALAQRLMPRIMPEILYQVRSVAPAAQRNRSMGLSLALAIVSLALLIPLIAIALTELGALGGLGAALIGVGVVCLAVVLINIAFNVLLFSARS